MSCGRRRSGRHTHKQTRAVCCGAAEWGRVVCCECPTPCLCAPGRPAYSRTHPQHTHTHAHTHTHTRTHAHTHTPHTGAAHLQRQDAPHAGAVEVLLHNQARHVGARGLGWHAAAAKHGVVEALAPLAVLLIPVSVRVTRGCVTSCVHAMLRRWCAVGRGWAARARGCAHTPLQQPAATSAGARPTRQRLTRRAAATRRGRRAMPRTDRHTWLGC
jgi:hypothetical protein